MSAVSKDLTLIQRNRRSESSDERFTVKQLNQLPGELLTSVFYEVVREYISEVPGQTFEFLPRAPFMLAAVCTTWRNLMLGTSVLWTMIVINLDAPSWPVDYMDILDLFLTRSGSAWLHLSLIEMWRETHRADFKRRSLNLKVSLAAVGDRVRSLGIQSNVDPLLAVSEWISFPHLTHLHFFHTPPFPDPTAPMYTWMSPEALPSLVDVRFATSAVSAMNDHLLQGLYRLSCSVESWSVYITHTPIARDLLAAAANTVRALAISVNDPRNAPGSYLSLRIGRLQHLEELYILGETLPGDEPYDQIGRFFDNLHSAPSLRVLWIDHSLHVPSGMTWNRNAFSGLAQRSDMGHTLVNLSIWSCLLVDEDVVEMIKLLPNVQFLTVVSPHDSEVSSSSTRVLDYLTPAMSGDGPPSDVVLPKLESLRVSIHGASRIAWRLAAVTRLAETRCRPSGYQRLSRMIVLVDDSLLEITDPESSVPLFIDRLLQCRSLGLTLHLKYMPRDTQRLGHYYSDTVAYKRSNPLIPGVPL